MAPSTTATTTPPQGESCPRPKDSSPAASPPEVAADPDPGLEREKEGDKKEDGEQDEKDEDGEEEEEEAPDLSLFADPEGYYPPTPPPTTQSYTLSSFPPHSSSASSTGEEEEKGKSVGVVGGGGETLTLHLVGSSPLEAHRLWNGSRAVSSYLESRPSLVRGRAVLELGAGAGLPSLVAAVLGARTVVVTDFPDPELVANLWKNVEGAGGIVEGRRRAEREALREKGEGGEGKGEEEVGDQKIVADGFVWGADPAPLLAHLSPSPSSPSSPSPSSPSPPSETPKFDILILADLLFRHSEHAKLLKTISETLSTTNPSAAALVFFTSYRPWLRARDLAFFDLARAPPFSFVVEQVLQGHKLEDPLFFEKDPGDEEVRRRVDGFVVRWPREGEGEGVEEAEAGAGGGRTEG